MQRDVKIGIAIGVLLIALIAVFWIFHKKSETGPTVVSANTSGEPPMPYPGQPVVPPSGLPGTGEGPGTGLPTPAFTVTPPVGPAIVGTTPAATTPPPATARTYKVQKGDSLSAIAKKFYQQESKWPVIYEKNKNKSGVGGPPKYMLTEGVVLDIPDISGTPPSTPPTPAVTAAAPAPAAGTQKYVVQKGDTLTSISMKFYQDSTPPHIDRIYQVNIAKIGDDKDNLKIGTELIIPPLIPPMP